MKKKKDNKANEMPSAEEVVQALGKANSIDDFYGKMASSRVCSLTFDGAHWTRKR